jgi:hypothetical protein
MVFCRGGNPAGFALCPVQPDDEGTPGNAPCCRGFPPGLLANSDPALYVYAMKYVGTSKNFGFWRFSYPVEKIALW